MITGITFFLPVTNYLDDFLFLAFLQSVCNRLMSSFMAICKGVGCPISDEKTVWASEEIVFLGMLLNRRFFTISIPVEKVIKALSLLKLMLSKKKVTIKMIQQLTGTLNFFNRVVVPGRTFTRRMYDNLKLKNKQGQSLKNHHHVKLSKGFQEDCKVWLMFLQFASTENVRLCMPFVDLEMFQYADQLEFFTDSSLNKDLGMVAVFRNRWLVGQWGRAFIEEQQPSIEFLELYALVAAILTWSRYLTNTRIIIFCDNQAAMHMVNNLTAKCPQCMKLIWL